MAVILDQYSGALRNPVDAPLQPLAPQQFAHLARRPAGVRLQLLAGGPNIQKSATLRKEWLDGLGAKEAAEHRRLHDLGEVPAKMADVDQFYEARRDRLLGRLETLLGTKIGVADESSG